MKTMNCFIRIFLSVILLFGITELATAQEKTTVVPKPNLLNQRVSISVEEENLSKVIEKLCKELNLDYSFNAKLFEGKKVSINLINRPLKEVFEKLMKDYYLLFEIENNILVVRDYIPIKENLFYDKSGNFIFPNSGFYLDNQKIRKMSIRFKTASNLIIIPVQINNSDTLNFILDTGVQYPIITELPYINKLNLNYLRAYELQGWGLDEPITAYRSAGNLISIPGLTAKNQDIQLIINEEFQVSQILGMPVHGLIGFCSFKNFVVEIDYLNERLTLIRPDLFKYKKRKNDIELPLEIIESRPYIKSTVMIDESTEVPVRLLLDTGASDALWIISESDKRLKMPATTMHTFLGKGLSGELYGNRGRYKAIKIDNKILKEPIIAFPDSLYSIYILKDSDRNGTLGSEILRRFNVTIDYPNSRIILHPNKNIDEEFNCNMSGMEVLNPMPGFPIYIVSNIREGSPAYLAGIRKDDQIITINGRTHRDISLNDINLLLQSRENKKIKIAVLRNGEKMETTFILKKEF
ncbi:MAG: aspartyl protease family protein [Bacteroidota bacterium]|nr:aspartyl protease family protein [Bacteroidota bacterium]